MWNLVEKLFLEGFKPVFYGLMNLKEKAIMNITTDLTSYYHSTAIMKYYRVATAKYAFALMTHFGN